MHAFFSSVANVDFAVLTPAMVAIVGVGVATAARRAGGSGRLALGVTAVLCLWLAVAAALSLSGALSAWAPPRWPLLPLVGLVTVIGLSRTATVRTLLSNMPVHVLIAAQSFRIFVELGLFALHESGRAPAQVTFEGRNFDILVGLTAPLVAWLVATKRARLAVVAAWNVAGLLVLASTIATVASSTPGPLHATWPGEPFTALVVWPIIWLPAFLVPLAVFLHIGSIRQTRLSTSIAPR